MGLLDDWAVIEGWCRQSARIGEVLKSHPKPKTYKYEGLDFSKSHSREEAESPLEMAKKSFGRLGPRTETN
jgi:hypothetical protein